MARKCKWTPKSPMQRRSAAQDRAAWRGWHSVRACTDPWWRTLPANGITDADMHRSYSFYVMAAHEELVRSLIEEQPDITLAELETRLAKKKVLVGRSSISRFLNHLKIAL
jgi:hypothetical protein